MKNRAGKRSNQVTVMGGQGNTVDWNEEKAKIIAGQVREEKNRVISSIFKSVQVKKTMRSIHVNIKVKEGQSQVE